MVARGRIIASISLVANVLSFALVIAYSVKRPASISLIYCAKLVFVTNPSGPTARNCLSLAQPLVKSSASTHM